MLRTLVLLPSAMLFNGISAELQSSNTTLLSNIDVDMLWAPDSSSFAGEDSQKINVCDLCSYEVW